MFGLLCFALGVLSEMNEAVKEARNASTAWSNVYDKLNDLRTQITALKDKLADVCMCLIEYDSYESPINSYGFCKT